MDMIWTDLHLLNGDVILLRDIGKELPHPLLHLALQHVSPVLGRPDQVVEGIVDGMGCASQGHAAIVTPQPLILAAGIEPAAKIALIPPRRKQRGSLSVFRAGPERVCSPRYLCGNSGKAGKTTNLLDARHLFIVNFPSCIRPTRPRTSPRECVALLGRSPGIREARL